MNEPRLGSQDRAPYRWVNVPAGPVVIIDATLGFHFRVTLTEPATLNPPQNGVKGQPIVLRVEQPATGGHALTPSTSLVFRNGETVLGIDTTAGAVTYVFLSYDDVASAWNVITPLSRSRADGLYAAAGSYQPLDADLTAIAALTTATYGRSLLTLATAAAGRLSLNVGSNIFAQDSIVTSLADTNENDLMTYTVPASTLVTRDDRLLSRFVFFTNAAVPVTRRIRIYYGSTVVFDTTALAGLVSATLVVDVEVVRTGGSKQDVIAIPHCDITKFTVNVEPTRTAPTENNAGTVVFKATSQQGAGAGAVDVTQREMAVDYIPVFA